MLLKRWNSTRKWPMQNNMLKILSIPFWILASIGILLLYISLFPLKKIYGENINIILIKKILGKNVNNWAVENCKVLR